SGSPIGTELRAIVNGTCGAGTFNALGLDPGQYQFDFMRGASALTVSVTVRDPVAMWDTAWSLPNRSSREQVDAYLDHMQATGFAGTWISIAPFNWQGGVNDGNFYGDPLGSFSNPNEQYLAHVDYIIDQAALHGLGVGVVVAWGTDYTGLHPGTWPSSTTFGAATDRFEPCHPDPYSVIGAGRAAALPAGYFTACDPSDSSDPRNQKAYDYGFLLGDRWKAKSNVRWVMGGDYWDGTSEPLTEQTWIKITDGLTAAGANQPVTYQPGGYQSSWDRFAGDPWVDEVSFNHHCLEGTELEDVLAGLATYGKDVIASEVRYEDEFAGWCPNAVTIGAAEIIADAQAILDSGADHYVYGHDKRWAWSQNDTDGDGTVDALDSLGDAGEQAALELLGANLPAGTPSVPAPDPDARFAVIGDFGSDLQAEGDVAALVDSLTPDFIVTTGDNVYSAVGELPVTYDNRVGRYYADYIGAYSGAYGTGSPTNRFFPSPGNHDYTDIGSTTDLAEYEAFFTLPGAGIPTTDTSDSERYYDFVQGPVHFFILDSQAILASGSETTAEAVWLQNALAASTAPWQAVVLHHAPYSSSSAHGSTPGLQWPYAAWGADMVFAGHDHSLERLTVDGIPYVVSGAGGRSLYGIADPPLPESDFAYSADYGAVLVDACTDGLTITFHSVGDGLIDTSTVGSPCGAANPDLVPPTWPVGATLSITDLTLTSVSLEWTAAVDNSAVVGYRLYDGGDTLLDTVAGTNTTVSGLSPNTGYTVRVEAYDAAGNESQPLTGLTLGSRIDLPAGDRPHSVDIADLNGDGANDLVVAAAGSDAAGVLLGTGTGSFSPVTLYPAGPGGEFPKNVDIADVDENGTLDVLTANQNTNRFGFLPGAGDGTFGPAVTFATRAGAHDVVAADFNNDDNLDVAVVGWGDSMIATWQGDGGGVFSSPADFEAGGTPHAVVAADFDDSGSIDLAIASHSLSAVRVLSGTGAGTFGSPANHAVTGSAHDVALADFNNDGDEDLVTADESGDNVSVLLGIGGVGFAGAVPLPVGDQPKGVAVGALNGDGATDIVAASIRGNYPNVINPGGDPLSVWLGNGDGTFIAGPTFTAGEAPFDAAVGDLNGDGHNDLVAANWHNDTVSVFLNLGRGGPATSFTTTDTPFTVVPEIGGLTFPTAVEFAPDGRIFVAEKSGVLKAFNGFDDANPVTVFDISAQVNDQLDRGLLGLAIHPDFPGTPYVFGLYTSVEPFPGTAGTVSNKLSRWEVDLTNSLVGSEQVLIHDWCQVFESHSAGDLEFGPDGYLYATAGDGASFTYSDSGPDACADPVNEGGSLRVQDVLTSVGGEGADPVGLDGSVIRVDPLTGDAAPGNPLAGGAIAGDDRIIAHGLRNPFRT
ncbi:MAG: VCBS repeat-containing protein, partial [Acidimicrobiia bacterium]|nr:VCBS repeat-containing protein [Acidimicrobiia bacterium]